MDTKNSALRLLFLIVCSFLLINCGSDSDMVNPSYWRDLFSDSFDRHDAHLGCCWSTVVDGGSFKVLDNKAHIIKNGATPTATYVSYIGLNNIRISVNVDVSGDATTDVYSGPAFVFARSDNDESADVNSYVCGYYGSSSKISIGIYEEGVYSSLSDTTADFVLPDGTSSSLIFELNDSSLTCSFAGDPDISADTNLSVTTTDGTHRDGFAGMGGGQDNAPYLYFDNFLIKFYE
ncbi:hypothetical protein KJ966_07485 [bacterium]|nr:hypothetical protein [bacterium]